MLSEGEYVLPDAKFVGGRMVPVSELSSSTIDNTVMTPYGPITPVPGFNPFALQQMASAPRPASAPPADNTVMTPYGPITPVPGFNPFALQQMVPATPQQAAQVSAQAQATEASALMPPGPPIPIGPAVMDPVWLRSDCNCRGGQFVEVPGQPQNSFCLPPAMPTGKMFDVASRGCVPIPGFRRPIVPAYQQYCYYGRYNLCLIGGIAVGALLLLWALKGSRKSDSKPIAPEITGPGV